MMCVQRRPELPYLRSFIPSGQMRLRRLPVPVPNPSPWLGFRARRRLRRTVVVDAMAAASAPGLAGNAGEARLVDRCIDAAARSPAFMEAWRRQRRSLERLPGQLADALLRRLTARRLLRPLLEAFRHSVKEIDLRGNIAVDAEWLAYLGSFRYLRILKLADCKNVNPSPSPVPLLSVVYRAPSSSSWNSKDASIRWIGP